MRDMKKTTTTKSMRRSLPVFAQIVHLIPAGLIERLSAGCSVKARVLSYARQIHSLILGQLSGAFSLNEICDSETVHAKKLFRIRGMVPAKRNTFSHANRTRDPSVAEKLFWTMLDRLTSMAPRFARPGQKGQLARFRLRRIFAVDSTVLLLTLKSFDWAKYRGRKAAAKLHMACEVSSRLPAFACLTTGNVADVRQMLAVTAKLKAGDIAVFDRAYNDFALLRVLAARGVYFVVREKDNLRYGVVGATPENALPASVVSDETIVLQGRAPTGKYPEPLRRIRARVEVDGQEREMVFLTNNPDWAPTTIAQLYRSRWQVELLFKELQQTLQLRDFYGENDKAVAWQIWTAMLTHLMLRFLAFCSKWWGSYTRFAGVVRAALWERTDLMRLLQTYGTTPDPPSPVWDGKTPCLPGFERFCARAMGQHSA